MSTEDPQATTQRIRATALHLFVQRGYGNTTIEHISTAAGVGVATIYRRWSDKPAIANELYRAGVDSMRAIIEHPVSDDPRTEFTIIWRQLWDWASNNSNLYLFIEASTNAPWLTDQNINDKARVSKGERDIYTRLPIDAAPDFAGALIRSTIGAVLASGLNIEPDEIAKRLWRALTPDPN